LVDFDGDGKTDVISGSYTPGDLYLFRRADDGKSFLEGTIIKDRKGRAVNVGSASAAFAFDWDNDGDLDLIVGNIEAEVYLVPNEGSRTEPKFGERIELASGEGGDAGPTVADWDGDGVPDLLVGDGSGQVVLYRATGRDAKGRPKLAPPRVLVPGGGFEPRSAQEMKTNPHPGSRLKLCVSDFNGDGRPDLLVGDVLYATPEPAAPTPQEQADGRTPKQRYEDAMREYQEAIKSTFGGKLPGANGENAAQVKDAFEKARANEQVKAASAKLYRAQVAMNPSQTEYHGYVWVYLQKANDAKQAAGR